MKDNLMQSNTMMNQYNQQQYLHSYSQDNLFSDKAGNHPPPSNADPLLFLAKLQIGAPITMAPLPSTIPSKERYLAVLGQSQNRTVRQSQTASKRAANAQAHAHKLAQYAKRESKHDLDMAKR